MSLTSKLAVFVSALALVACNNRAEAPEAEPIVLSPGDRNYPTTIFEICYDGTVYLVTAYGGFAPKLKTTWNGTAGSSAVTVECKVTKNELPNKS